MQEVLVTSDPERFYRPKYVGHKGWIGIRMEGAPDWDLVAGLVRDSYRMTAPEIARCSTRRQHSARQLTARIRAATVARLARPAHPRTRTANPARAADRAHLGSLTYAPPPQTTPLSIAMERGRGEVPVPRPI